MRLDIDTIKNSKPRWPELYCKFVSWWYPDDWQPSKIYHSFCFFVFVFKKQKFQLSEEWAFELLSSLILWRGKIHFLFIQRVTLVSQSCGNYKVVGREALIIFLQDYGVCVNSEPFFIMKSWLLQHISLKPMILQSHQ